MSTTIAIMSMSLDGYVADPDDGVAEVFDWYTNSGDVELHTGGSDPMTFRCPSRARSTSAASRPGWVPCSPVDAPSTPPQGWGGNHAWGPAFVLTHHVPDGWPRPGSTVNFVTDGIDSAVAQARAAAAGSPSGSTEPTPSSSA